MNRPARREVEVIDPKRKLTVWEREQKLIAAGPKQLKDGRWQGCRHFIPAPTPVTGHLKTGEPIFGSAPVGRCWTGPGPHTHEEDQ